MRWTYTLLVICTLVVAAGSQMAKTATVPSSPSASASASHVRQSLSVTLLPSGDSGLAIRVDGTGLRPGQNVTVMAYLQDPSPRSSVSLNGIKLSTEPQVIYSS